jgi:hypothetical protein
MRRRSLSRTTKARGLVKSRKVSRSGSQFLHRGDHDRKGRKDHKNQRFCPVAEKKVEYCAHKQESQHRLFQDVPQYAQCRAILALRQLVMAVAGQAIIRLRLCEAGKANP